MQDRPTARELLDAAEDFLRSDLRGRLEGRDAFLALVTANVLGIVKRELDSFEASNAAEAERLRTLLGAMPEIGEIGLLELNRELCRRIRSGAIGVGDERLVDHLVRTTLAKVAVDNPRYAGYRTALRYWPLHAPAAAGTFDARR
jgi:hypothetical protein